VSSTLQLLNEVRHDLSKCREENKGLRETVKSLLAAENRSIRVRAYLTKTQRQLLWLEIQKLNEKVN
jgi:hypothetical protein